MKKDPLRKATIERRNNLSWDTVIKNSKAITNHIKSIIEYKESKRIMIYKNFQKEVQTKDIIEDALKEGKKVYLPRIELNTTITSREVRGSFDLEEGVWGIYQPKDNTPIINPWELDLILVPGVAFDYKGNRMGFGKGYYDKFLKDAGGAFTLGICHSAQLFEGIPVTANDIPVKGIITEKGILYIL
jgi:5-formyltetrahydrofolate cyclo-ligase